MITSTLKQEKLFSNIAMANIEIKEKEKEKKILLVIMVLGALVFTFGILLINSFYKSKSAKLTMAHIENDKII